MKFNSVFMIGCSRIPLLLFVFLFSCLPLFSQKIKDLKKKKEVTRQQIQKLNSLVERTGESLRDLHLKYDALNTKVSYRRRLISYHMRELSLVEERINLNEEVLSVMTQDLKKLLAIYNAALQAIQKRYLSQERLLIQMLASEDFNSFYKKYNYVNQYLDHRKRQYQNIKELAKEIKRKNRDLALRKNRKLSILSSLDGEREELQTERQVQKKMIATLRTKKKSLLVELEQQKKVQANLSRQIASLLVEVQRRVVSPEQKKEQSTETRSFSKRKGSLRWPVEGGVVTLPFGRYKDSSLNIVRSNLGINITTSNPEVRSVHEGTVVRVFRQLGSHLNVIVRHGNFMTVYSNIGQLRVKQGDKVGEGQLIGTLIHSTLLFCLYNKTVKQDPEEWLLSNY